MLELRTIKSGEDVSVNVRLSLKGFQPFGAEIFRFQISSEGYTNVVTWDNRALQCVSSKSTLTTIADALGKSDLLGLKLPKQKSERSPGIVQLENRADEWPVPDIIQIVRLDGEGSNASYKVMTKGTEVGILENIPYGFVDGEVRELLIAAIKLVQNKN